MHIFAFMQKLYSVTVGLVLAVVTTGECLVSTPSRAKTLSAEWTSQLFTCLSHQGFSY